VRACACAIVLNVNSAKARAINRMPREKVLEQLRITHCAAVANLRTVLNSVAMRNLLVSG
jgi:hypothetical protein